jgi:molybdenum cofactor synthesis domain-containing protein
MKKNKFMTIIKVDDAVGKVLPHDITEIVPGKVKGAAFKKGHIIRKQDIKKLKSLGKEHIYTINMPKNHYHEDEAALKFRKLGGKNIKTTGPVEGKVQFIAACDGFLKMDKKAVDKINNIKDMVFTTIHSDIPVKKNDLIAGIRIIPLVVDKKSVQKVLKIGSVPPISIAPFKKKKVGLIVTGEEVASGKIKDGFRPVMERKMKEYGYKINEFKIIGDDIEKLTNEILAMKKKGCDFIMLTGGMSVDPDDITKVAIKRSGVKVVSYGAPILPGNMFMAGYLKDIPVFGVPACALFYNITALDLFLPYVFSNTKINKKDITMRGYGGFCRYCKVCIFPRCGFGKC